MVHRIVWSSGQVWLEFEKKSSSKFSLRSMCCCATTTYIEFFLEYKDS